MAVPVCNDVNLKSGAVCYLTNVINPTQQKALLIYAKALELAAIGGTNYANALATGLVSDAVSMTCGMDEANRDAARVNLAFINAANAGAAVPGSINAKLIAVRCLEHIDPKVLDSMDLLLTCRLGIHADYPQA